MVGSWDMNLAVTVMGTQPGSDLCSSKLLSSPDNLLPEPRLTVLIAVWDVVSGGWSLGFTTWQ